MRVHVTFRTSSDYRAFRRLLTPQAGAAGEDGTITIRDHVRWARLLQCFEGVTVEKVA